MSTNNVEDHMVAAVDHRAIVVDHRAVSEEQHKTEEALWENLVYAWTEDLTSGPEGAWPFCKCPFGWGEK